LRDRRHSPVLGVVVKSSFGSAVFGIDNRIVAGFEFPEQTGSGSITCLIDSLPLMPGRYTLDLWLGDRQRSLDAVKDAATFQVVASNVTGTGKLPPANCGPVFWPARWELEAHSLQSAVPGSTERAAG